MGLEREVQLERDSLIRRCFQRKDSCLETRGHVLEVKFGKKPGRWRDGAGLKEVGKRLT
jgi:hypothetical protein